MTTPLMTILCANYSGLPGLTILCGFAAMIRTSSRTILLDTGSNGRVLLKSMAAFDRAPESTDLLFLSHPHWDYISGLDSFLEVNPRSTVSTCLASMASMATGGRC